MEPQFANDPTVRALEAAIERAAASNDVQAAQRMAHELGAHLQRLNQNLGANVAPTQSDIVREAVQEKGQGTQVAEGALAGVRRPVLNALQYFGMGEKKLPFQDQTVNEAERMAADVQGANLATRGGSIGAGLSMAALPVRPATSALNLASRALPAVRPAAQALEASRMAAMPELMATQGAYGYAFSPGDEDERMRGALMGMGLATIPAGVGAVQSARRSAPYISTEAGRRLKIAEELRRNMGAGEASDVIEKLRKGRYPTEDIGVTPSAAMLSENPWLQAYETGSRVKSPQLWTPLDARNAAARWDELISRAGSDEELKVLRELRDEATESMRNTALNTAGWYAQPGGRPMIGSQRANWAATKIPLDDYAMQPLLRELEVLESGRMAANADVQKVVRDIRSKFEQGITSPEQLYEIRQNLAGKVPAGQASELQVAARNARPHTIDLFKQLDKVLDDLSGGLYGQYMEKFASMSPQITSKESLQNIVKALRGHLPEGAVPESMGVQPTKVQLAKLIDRLTHKQFGTKVVDRLTPEDRAFMANLLRDLERQRMGMTARATIGSPTAPFLRNASRIDDMTAAVIDETVGRVPLAGRSMASGATRQIASDAERAAAEVLQDPKLMAEYLRRAENAQRIFGGAARSASGAGGANRNW